MHDPYPAFLILMNGSTHFCRSESWASALQADVIFLTTYVPSARKSLLMYHLPVPRVHPSISFLLYYSKLWLSFIKTKDSNLFTVLSMNIVFNPLLLPQPRGYYKEPIFWDSWETMILQETLNNIFSFSSLFSKCRLFVLFFSYLLLFTLPCCSPSHVFD